MNISAVVFDPGGLSGHDEMMLFASANAITMAGEQVLRALPDQALEVSFEANPDYCHYMWPGAVILPQFYRAMIAACEHAGTDYAYCHCARVRQDHSIITTPTPEHFALSQLVVKSWAMLELATKGNPSEVIKDVLKQYRGTEVPHVLTLEIFP
jgi:hypothetical protein